MKRVLTTSIYLLGILIVMGFTMSPILADPVITIQMGHTRGGELVVLEPSDLKNTSAKLAFTVDSNTGMFFINVTNNTGAVLTGLEITVTPQPTDLMGVDEAGFFTTQPQAVQFAGSKSQIIFSVTTFNFPGKGIPRGAMFTIKLSNFSPQTTITITPETPEPTTVILLGTGLAGVAIKTRKKLKIRKSKQESNS